MLSNWADRAGGVPEDADDRVVEEDHVVEEGDGLSECGFLHHEREKVQ